MWTHIFGFDAVLQTEGALDIIAIVLLREAHSSRGLGRFPLKEEITGPNPVCATKYLIPSLFVANSYLRGSMFPWFYIGLYSMLGANFFVHLFLAPLAVTLEPLN